MSTETIELPSFPREHNGYIDNGEKSRGSCPGCRSNNYYQTVSIEHCPDCGLFFDYWGKFGNDVYNKMLEGKHRIEDISERYGNSPFLFSPEQVLVLCGGRFPDNGFDWDSVEYFKMEDGALQPYDNYGILPGPGIELMHTLVDL